MKTKSFLTVILICTLNTYGFNIYAQYINMNVLRKVVLKSDVIFAGKSQTIKEHPNDYTTDEYLLIEKMDTLLKGDTSFKLPDYRIKVWEEDNDYFYSRDKGLLSPMRLFDIGKEYRSLFFLKKEGDRYRLLGYISMVEWDEIINQLAPTISSLKEVEQTTDPAQRFSKTIDWFIDNYDFPESDFFIFYKNQGIYNDTLQLTQEQLDRAKKSFLEGKEDLYLFIEDAFPKEIKTYYLNKLKNISRKTDPDYWDYRDFENIIDTYYKFDYESANYIKLQSLTDQKSTSKEIKEKTKTMNYFINMLENKK